MSEIRSTICLNCEHNLPGLDCEFQCIDVTGYDPELEIVTDCDDYEPADKKERKA